ncbi:t-SNARE affecting a late Golgi compartment protein 1 [Tolypocladium paradoxum]|uniref:t-SNARE affecting a late Golgi compartment protein 1 n=1 Tax=Tolypocladium paradoxum TaxID=94208 RepID=A0A2S4L0Q2_9HYPO|nr:t-SNARE affecting a late Golgi compartment protein 1 [Tolypocladium paradoxum]
MDPRHLEHNPASSTFHSDHHHHYYLSSAATLAAQAHASQATGADRMMSSTNEEDPFLQVQQDVLTQLSSTRPLFASYLRIRSLSTNASSPELASARSDLESALASLAEDLADLVASVQAVESNPAQYGLSADEVARRGRLVQEVGGEIEDMREELNKNIDNARVSGADLPDPSSFAIADGDGGDGYAEFEQQQQVEMMREQDQHLDGVFQTVGNLRRQADDMGRELEEQHEMLELVDEAADRVGSRLQSGMQKLQHVIRKNEDRWSSCCIAVLIFVLILLLVLLLIL